MAEPIFELDTAYQFYMSLLVNYLEKNEKYATAQLVQKAGFEIHTGYEYDNWNGGTYGHKVIMFVAQEIFISILDEKDSYIEDIKSGLNKIYNKDNEYVALIDISVRNDNSNVINSAISVYTQNKLPSFTDIDLNRIWGNKPNLKVFISHRDIDKKEASVIQKKLLKFNISSFVAHEDIKATEEWIKEILRALQSMDIFLVYMTDDFLSQTGQIKKLGSLWVEIYQSYH